MSLALESSLTGLLTATSHRAGFRRALVCTQDGLLVASSGASGDERDERLAALVAMFDDVVLRARRDLGLQAVDELTLLDGEEGRVVVRPLADAPEGRMFLVVELPRGASWRRHTGALRSDVVTRLRAAFPAEVSS